MDRQNAKRTFGNLKKYEQLRKLGFDDIRTQLSEPLSADKNQWFQDVYWLLLTNICHFGSPENLLLSNSALLRVAFGICLV